jgi:hypothetical protein
MRLKIEKSGVALHPSETVVEIRTALGTERLVVDKRSIESNSLSVGSPVGKRDDLLLVELPRETMTGLWRVWVKKNSLLRESG